jgi:ubiquinone/menaquinone biosynthesis C-methylase UbiE
MSESNLRKQIGFYTKRAGRFDRSITSLGSRDNRNHRKKIGAIARALGLSGEERVLEVGTGTGLHAAWLLEHTPVEYWGLDASAEMLDVASDRLGPKLDRVRLVVGDAARLPFPDASFPAAFCSGTLHHLAAPWTGVAELARVVVPGGRVAAMEPNWKFPIVLVISAVSAVERNAFKISPRRLAEWGRAAGLEDVTVSPLLYTPPRPRSLERLFDAVDDRARAVPGLRAFSIMMLMSGRRSPSLNLGSFDNDRHVLS